MLEEILGERKILKEPTIAELETKRGRKFDAIFNSEEDFVQFIGEDQDTDNCRLSNLLFNFDFDLSYISVTRLSY